MIIRALRPALLLSLGICAGVFAAQSPEEIVVLKGQQRFLDASIQMCRERMPALGKDLSAAHDHAARELRKAERLIVDSVAPTIKRDQRHLDMFADMWSRSADQLIEGLKRQNAEQACPTLVANWQAIEADTVVEDWENFLGRNTEAAEGAESR